MEQNQVEERLNLKNRHVSGANWFFWIAVLSLVNSGLILGGSEWNFVVGLGVTQLVDGVFSAIAAELGNGALVFAGVVDLVVAGLFVLFGILARKPLHWAFITGMVLYALDGMLFLLIGDWLSIAFHAFVLFGMFQGLKASQGLQQVDGQAAPQPA
jgi:hypothetical protein